MPNFVPNELSVRERALEALVVKFRTMRKGDDGYTVTWDVVRRFPVSTEDKAFNNVLSVIDTRELKAVDQNRSVRGTLRISLEFWSRLKLGEDPSVEGNRLLADLQRRYRDDISLGGLVLNLEESANEIDIEGPDDRIVAGFIFIDMQYRHQNDDPRRIT